MARARNIKPELFWDENLGSCPPCTRLFFIGLLVYSSNDGVISPDKTKLKDEIYPFNNDVDVVKMMDELEEKSIIKININGDYSIVDLQKWCSVIKNKQSSFYSSNRRAYKKNAMPKWADKNEIKRIYKHAKSISSNIVNYHVDHIIPLKNQYVCGLHVHQNLQVITATENIKKSNKFNGDFNA